VGALLLFRAQDPLRLGAWPATAVASRGGITRTKIRLLIVPWERVERLDAATMIQALQTSTGVRLDLVGPCSGGQVGAAYVRWPDGHLAVLKSRPDIGLADLQRGPLAIVDVLRSIGYPAPGTELAAAVGSAVVTVQELLPGSEIGYVDLALLEQALALNRLHVGVLAGRPDIEPMKLYLTSDAGGFCLHEPLRKFSSRSAALERWVRGIGVGCPDELVGDDAVHCDFHPANMLASDGRVTGVIDWDGASRGDCRFDLVTLRFGVHGMKCDPDVIGKLDEVLDFFPTELLLPAWAHMSLRMVDWAIRHFTAADVEHWLDLAEQRAF
jgi:hypothetical protein